MKVYTQEINSEICDPYNETKTRYTFVKYSILTLNLPILLLNYYVPDFVLSYILSHLSFVNIKKGL